jgi:hypothetical protein
MQDKATSSTQEDLEFNNTYVAFNGTTKNVSLNAGQRAIKMRLLKIGEGSNNISAFYWHYSPVTCANVGDSIGAWNFLEQATLTGTPVIFKADAGDSGVGFGTLKFQANDGFPYTPTISGPTSAVVPTWLSGVSQDFSLSSFTWIEDDFETSSFDCWWNSEFIDNYQIIEVSGYDVAIKNLKLDNYTPFQRLSRNNISGDFMMETSIVFSGGRTSSSNPESIEGTSINIPWISLYYFSVDEPFIYNTLECVVTPVSGNRIGFKFERINNYITSFYKDGDLDWQTWSSFTYSADIYLNVRSNGYAAFDYFRIIAEGGLPNTYTLTTSSVSSISSVDIISAVDEEVITSAEAKIIGSTIYLSAGSVGAWKDNFNTDDYTDQNNYEIELTDSVFVNFQKEEETDFENCSEININNCTFNNSEEEINNI